MTQGAAEAEEPAGVTAFERGRRHQSLEGKPLCPLSEPSSLSPFPTEGFPMNKKAENHCQPATGEAVTVEKVSSRYQTIEIMRHSSYGHLLVIDDDLQIAESDEVYGKAMVSPLLNTEPVERVAILGGGDGGVLLEVLKAADTKAWPLKEALLVDIDPEVIRLSQRYLRRINQGAFEDPRAKILTEDASAYIRNESGLDAVLYDLTMEPVRTNQPRTDFIREVLSNILSSLRPGGIFSMQCCGEGNIGPILGDQNEALLDEIRTQVDRLFVDRKEQQVAVPSYHELWTFLAARKGKSQ